MNTQTPEKEQEHEKRAYAKGRVWYRADRGAWFIDYYHNGQKIREKVGATEEAAQRRLTKRMREKEREDFVTPPEQRITVAGLLDARETYLTNKGAMSGSAHSYVSSAVNADFRPIL